MELLMAILFGLVLGGGVSWLFTRFNTNNNFVLKNEFEALKQANQELEISLALELEKNKSLAHRSLQQMDEIKDLNTEVIALGNKLASKVTLLNTLQKQLEGEHIDYEKLKGILEEKITALQLMERNFSSAEAQLKAEKEKSDSLRKEMALFKLNFDEKTSIHQKLAQQFAHKNAENNALQEKLNVQKQEMDDMRKKFNLEFEHIASKIIEDKSEKFTKMNEKNLDALLKPLDEKINHFKKKVEEVYDKEAKERFSLGKEVEKLVHLNQRLSTEAQNLTNALKGDAKFQGDWGQMILENILEKSGLIKGSEYFVQDFLKDEDGKYIKNQAGSKLQPDVIIAYPDERKVIIDSKVSLTAFVKYNEATSTEEQKLAVQDHLKSMRKHVDDLSKKSYQDFAHSLDFAMMFVPSEPAYLLALQHDPDLWYYAYNKRIVFINPTNLITALKLLEDLWKREHQNQNALAIAERGAALYDKFVGFIENLQDVGLHIERTQKSYQNAYNKLSEGRGNLISQAEKLKELGVKSKKNIPKSLISSIDKKNETD